VEYKTTPKLDLLSMNKAVFLHKDKIIEIVKSLGDEELALGLEISNHWMYGFEYDSHEHPFALPPPHTCEWCIYFDQAGSNAARCRRHSPSNSGVKPTGEFEYNYPVLPDWHGCGEGKWINEHDGEIYSYDDLVVMWSKECNQRPVCSVKEKLVQELHKRHNIKGEKYLVD